jgi:pimeloyl-ACP methyl ester carboxylesterase
MATFVLVHGPRHGGWAYKRVRRLLEADGHEVHTPTLTGLAERAHLLSPSVDLDHHIDDVVRELHHWDLHDVVLAGHTYYGLVVTGVADRVPERVGKLVYLDAARPEDGDSLAVIGKAFFDEVRATSTFVNGAEVVMPPEMEHFHGVVDPADQAWMRERLTAHPWRCLEQPLRLRDEAALDAIPTYYVECTNLEAKRARRPERWQQAEADGRVWVLDASHDLMISHPELTARVLEEIAAR